MDKKILPHYIRYREGIYLLRFTIFELITCISHCNQTLWPTCFPLVLVHYALRQHESEVENDRWTNTHPYHVPPLWKQSPSKPDATLSSLALPSLLSTARVISVTIGQPTYALNMAKIETSMTGPCWSAPWPPMYAFICVPTCVHARASATLVWVWDQYERRWWETVHMGVVLGLIAWVGMGEVMWGGCVCFHLRPIRLQGNPPCTRILFCRLSIYARLSSSYSKI